MEQKQFSRVLSAAGWIIGVAVVGVMAGYIPFVVLQNFSGAVYGIGLIWCVAMMVLFLIALQKYLLICRKIGQERSFCVENAQHLGNIARLLFAASGLSVCITVMMLVSGSFKAMFWIEGAVVAFGSGGMGVLAWALSGLVAHAAALQDENDLTI